MDSIALNSQLAPDSFIERVIPVLVIMDWIEMMPPLAIVSEDRGPQLRGQDKFPSPNPEFNAELLLGVIGWTYTEHTTTAGINLMKPQAVPYPFIVITRLARIFNLLALSSKPHMIARVLELNSTDVVPAVHRTCLIGPANT